MERLTDKREADAQRKEYENRIRNGYPRNIPEERFLRLAAYEDTHMMPSDVTSMRMDMAILTALFDGIDVDRMREIVAAERDGRVVVLPYGIGQRVFARLDTDEYVSECEVVHISISNKASYAVIEPIGARGREYGVPLMGLGRTVFLTRAEAEWALRKEKGMR